VHAHLQLGALELSGVDADRQVVVCGRFLLAFDPEKRVATFGAVACELHLHICCFCAWPYNLSASLTLKDAKAMVAFSFARFGMQASRTVNVSTGTP